MGDFNSVGTAAKGVGGNEVDRAEMEDFNQCLLADELQENNTKGLHSSLWIIKEVKEM